MNRQFAKRVCQIQVCRKFDFYFQVKFSFYKIDNELDCSVFFQPYVNFGNESLCLN